MQLELSECVPAGKPLVVVAHVAPPFAHGFDGLTDQQVCSIQVAPALSSLPVQVVALVASTFASMFGHTNPKIVASTVTHWEKDVFSRGSYSFAKVGSDVEQEADALATPEGRLFFAGEACSATNMQCVHGAFLSGEEAATSILEALDNKLF